MVDAVAGGCAAAGTNLQHGLVVGCRRSSDPEGKFTGVPLDVLGYAEL